MGSFLVYRVIAMMIGLITVINILFEKPSDTQLIIFWDRKLGFIYYAILAVMSFDQ